MNAGNRRRFKWVASRQKMARTTIAVLEIQPAACMYGEHTTGEISGAIEASATSSGWGGLLSAGRTFVCSTTLASGSTKLTPPFESSNSVSFHNVAGPDMFGHK